MALKLKEGTATATEAEAKEVKEEKVTKAEKTKAVVKAEAEVKEASENVGINSDKIELVATLVDPSQDDRDGDRVDPMVVGYRFKATIDLDVPDCPPTSDFKGNLMSYNSDMLGNTRKVKAGEEFDLTRFESGLLLAPEEFNGLILGGTFPARVVYMTVNAKDSKGNIVKTSSATPIPTVSIRALSGKIRDYKSIEVLSCKREVVNGGKAVRKIRTLNPGFDKFAPLTLTESAGKSKGSSAPKAKADPRTIRNDKADMFLQIVASKKAAKAAK